MAAVSAIRHVEYSGGGTGDASRGLSGRLNHVLCSDTLLNLSYIRLDIIAITGDQDRKLLKSLGR